MNIYRKERTNMSTKPMTLLLIEDSINECIVFENYVKQRNDVKFVAITNSDIEGLELIKKYSPDAIILDIELHKGSGNATSFNLIETLHKMKFKTKPKIIVTTVVTSNTVYDYLHEKGVDLIFYKKHKNYSVENVINTLLLLNDYSEETTTSATIELDNSAELEEKISQMINNELDLIGVGLHLQGRKYLHDAIYFVVTQSDKDERITVIQHLISKYKRSSSTISRAMQNAILHAWRRSSLEDLEKYYTARINYETGVPTPTEFVYYYAERVRKMV